MYDIKNYHRADNISHAVALLEKNPTARLLAGGTDVLIQLHHLNSHFEHIIDIHDLPELRGIQCDQAGNIRIASGTTFNELINHPIAQQHLPALVEAASMIAGPQIRNVATFGGNICNGAPSADSACPSLIYDATLEIASPEGSRYTSINGFHTGPGKVALAANEILTAFHFKAENYRNKGAASFKYAMRDAMDIATIGCSALCDIKQGKFQQLKLAFAVAAPTPIRCQHAEEAARGQALTRQTLAAIGKAVSHDVSPRTSWRAEKEFRLHLIHTLTERVINLAVMRAGGEII